eukprot:Hpha_TRINITY_DN8448_c0_g1::TRINITY_DN8448_c0_g1_i1::g.34563::m.34563
MASWMEPRGVLHVPRGVVRDVGWCTAHSHGFHGDELVLDAEVIRREAVPGKWDRYEALCCLKMKPRLDFALKAVTLREPGLEHYGVLWWIATHYAKRGGALLVEVGSREGASSFALAADPRNTVFSYDLNSTADHIASVMNFRDELKAKKLGKKSDSPYNRSSVQSLIPNAHYISTNLMDLTDPNNWRHQQVVLGSRVLLLDTYHEPESVPFEYGFIEFMDTNHYKGVMILDDIHLNSEMERFWQFLVKKYGPRRAIDITPIGHFSGTGILDFCGNTRFIDDGVRPTQPPKPPPKPKPTPPPRPIPKLGPVTSRKARPAASPPPPPVALPPPGTIRFLDDDPII